MVNRYLPFLYPSHGIQTWRTFLSALKETPFGFQYTLCCISVRLSKIHPCGRSCPSPLNETYSTVDKLVATSLQTFELFTGFSHNFPGFDNHNL